jgi:hypothetical protein
MAPAEIGGRRQCLGITHQRGEVRMDCLSAAHYHCLCLYQSLLAGRETRARPALNSNSPCLVLPWLGRVKPRFSFPASRWAMRGNNWRSLPYIGRILFSLAKARHTQARATPMVKIRRKRAPYPATPRSKSGISGHRDPHCDGQARL